jgi:hypothetical protein
VRPIAQQLIAVIGRMIGQSLQSCDAGAHSCLED